MLSESILKIDHFYYGCLYINHGQKESLATLIHDQAANAQPFFEFYGLPRIGNIINLLGE